jgi:regulator of protease activity HflC (stomatin/prohibitin superfamily)
VTTEQARTALRNQIARGASHDELKRVLRSSRDLTDRQRRILRSEMRRYDPRRITRRQVDAARTFLGRVGRRPAGSR